MLTLTIIILHLQVNINIIESFSSYLIEANSWKVLQQLFAVGQVQVNSKDYVAIEVKI
jgi:hypothetical protein